jgi:hypothetical protein
MRKLASGTKLNRAAKTVNRECGTPERGSVTRSIVACQGADGRN